VTWRDAKWLLQDPQYSHLASRQDTGSHTAEVISATGSSDFPVQQERVCARQLEWVHDLYLAASQWIQGFSTIILD
jgi:hypothetical protein